MSLIILVKLTWVYVTEWKKTEANIEYYQQFMQLSFMFLSCMKDLYWA